MNQSVCVINQNGRVLMPTTPRKAKLLLRDGKAEKVSYRPFTIRLLHGTRGYVQPVSLGIDAGYLHIGFSAVTESKELLGGELDLLPSVSERITEKARYRRVLLSSLAYGIGQAGHSQSRAFHPDAHPKRVERGASRLAAKFLWLGRNTTGFDAILSIFVGLQ